MRYILMKSKSTFVILVMIVCYSHILSASHDTCQDKSRDEKTARKSLESLTLTDVEVDIPSEKTKIQKEIC